MKVGPTSGDNGFPVWYEDENGVRLQLNLDPNDPFSGFAPEELPNPTQPVSFPNNFPSEAFYHSAEAEMTTGTGERARLVLALEAAFVGETPTDGEQIVFGRVRIRVSGLVANASYTVRHPYGTDTFIAEIADPNEPGIGEINFTEDIGSVNGGDFHLALNSRVHPFLRWDPAVLPPAPDGYLGDPNVLHPIIGSVLLDQNGQPQNYFRIDGPGIGIGSPDRLTDNSIETRNFTLLGTIATNSGVDVTRATYSKLADGSRFVDVFAISDVTPQEIEVTGPSLLPTRMDGTNGIYFTRANFTGDVVPSEVTVTNISDNPDSSKTVVPVDFVSATAEYNTLTTTLKIIAKSSNEIDNVSLIVSDFGIGDLSLPPDGNLVIAALNFSPANVTITSTAGGEITIPVQIISLSDNPTPTPVANAGLDQIVSQGSIATLDGSASTNVETYLWEQISGTTVLLSNANTANPSFTFPNQTESLTFRLTVSGPGGSSTDTVQISTVQNTLTVTRAEFRKTNAEWLIEGTSNIAGPGVTITIYLGNNSNGSILAEVEVDPDGIWSYRISDSDTQPDATRAITIQSTSGGILEAVPINIRR
ncbi:PKD domain-containing protein [Neobacillus niacini]|uniref:PKD domain-containing protein n=1 Tax=Neobacillus niacini TaxID=86668 RepID=UPI0005EF4117|nr:hypothetical protein [Neobacillus niacini]